jgi:hypothetical protein
LLSLLKANAVLFKPPNSKLFGYQKICVSKKYLWALPTPTTFEKVDQTFIINWQSNLPNHNLSEKRALNLYQGK